MHDVFVSYKAEDRARVAPLVDALEADGLSVWWDAHVGGGEEWRDSIAEHLDQASCVIVVWSKRSTGKEGRFVRDEATRALRRGIYLPIRIDRVEPPLGFGETQALPLQGWKGDRSDPRYIAVANAARSMLGQEAATSAARRSPAIARRPLLIGSGAALVAAGVGGWLWLKPGAADSTSIAVLPFANLSGDPAQAYFSDGMAEELRSALSRIGGLKVVARTSSEMLRDADAKTAARKLGVAHVLSGSVRRSPSTIRVNAQLIDGGDGMERWSETFDRPAGDVLKIQSGIAESVAQALSIRLAGADRAKLTLGGTRNPAAQDLLLRANPQRIDFSEASVQEALALLDAAIAIDPNFAEAHARKGFLLNVSAGSYAHSAAEAQRGYAEALASANRAVAIAPRLAIGYAVRGHILSNQLDLKAGLSELAKADALPGNDAAALRSYALVLARIGRSDEALQLITKAMSLDPLNPLSPEFRARILYYARQYEESAVMARRALQLSPEHLRALSILGSSLLQLNRIEEAEAEYRKLEPTDFRRLFGHALAAARRGDRGGALTHLRALRSEYGDAGYFQYGEIYAQLGDADAAFRELELAFKVRDPGLTALRVEPFLDPIRRDPRFAVIEAKLNFPRSR